MSGQAYLPGNTPITGFALRGEESTAQFWRGKRNRSQAS